MDTTKLQQWFDTAWAGLKSQGWAKSADSWKCRYRGPDGLKCAVGHLMNDEEAGRCDLVNAGPKHEVFTIHGVAPSADEVGFLRDLQKAHDIADGGEGMQSLMRAVAEAYGLAVP